MMKFFPLIGPLSDRRWLESGDVTPLYYTEPVSPDGESSSARTGRSCCRSHIITGKFWEDALGNKV
jgi:hypothetical protein